MQDEPAVSSGNRKFSVLYSSLCPRTPWVRRHRHPAICCRWFGGGMATDGASSSTFMARWSMAGADKQALIPAKRLMSLKRSSPASLPRSTIFRHDRPGDTLRGWLRVICRNKLLDYFRTRTKNPPAAGGTEARLLLAGIAANGTRRRIVRRQRTADARPPRGGIGAARVSRTRPGARFG